MTGSTPLRGGDDVSCVDLYWLPLGAGGRCVRLNGRVFEALVARREHRRAADLYHSALEVRLGPDRWVIEMAPVWNTPEPERGVVAEGPVGLRWLGRSRWFRYEVRCWRGGRIPDVDEAVDSPVRMSEDVGHAQRVLALAPRFRTATWALTSSTPATCGTRTRSRRGSSSAAATTCPGSRPPAGGRAPGWDAGLVAGSR